MELTSLLFAALTVSYQLLGISIFSFFSIDFPCFVAINRLSRQNSTGSPSGFLLRFFLDLTVCVTGSILRF